MKKLQEKLDFLLEKYSVDVKAQLKDEKTVIIDGKEIKTLPHSSERRFMELKNARIFTMNFIVSLTFVSTCYREK